MSPATSVAPRALRLRRAFLLVLSAVLALGTASTDRMLVLTGPGDASETETLIGWAVVASRGQIAAAAPHASLGGRAHAGAVHVFDAATGTLLRTLHSPVPAADEGFGYALAMDAEFIVVGAPRATLPGAELAGAVYLFERRTGTLVRRFREPRLGAGHEFGFAVGLDAGRVAIASPGATAGATPHAGAVYLFSAESGALLQRFTAAAPAEGEGFAQTLALAGRCLVVGVPFAAAGTRVRAGAVDAFDVRTGRLLRRIREPAPAAHAGFGAALDLAAGRLLVGAPDRGVVHLLRGCGGLPERMFQSSAAPAERDRFGHAVALDRASVVVGAPHARRDAHAAAGAAYVFDAESGSLRHTLHAPAPAAGSDLGIAVVVDHGTVVAGAQRAPTPSGRGAVYVLRP